MRYQNKNKIQMGGLEQINFWDKVNKETEHAVEKLGFIIDEIDNPEARRRVRANIEAITDETQKMVLGLIEAGREAKLQTKLFEKYKEYVEVVGDRIADEWTPYGKPDTLTQERTHLFLKSMLEHTGVAPEILEEVFPDDKQTV